MSNNFLSKMTDNFLQMTNKQGVMLAVSVTAFITAILLIAVLVSNTDDSGSVIYGKDNRLDMYRVSKKEVLDNAAATVSLWNKNDLFHVKESESIILLTRSFGSARYLCKDEPFWSQVTGPHCSGFLVGDDIVVTAGHCITTKDSMLEKVFVFGFKMKDSSKVVDEVSDDNIYYPVEIISRQLTNTGADYCVVRLDRKVKGVKPMVLAKEDAKVGDDIYVLGHPSGLPLKYADGAKVIRTFFSHFEATLDTYGGNSGSPVFNSNHEVVGILVRGATDYIYDKDRNCVCSNKKSDNDLFGEAVTNVSIWREFVNQTQIGIAGPSIVLPGNINLLQDK